MCTFTGICGAVLTGVPNATNERLKTILRKNILKVKTKSHFLTCGFWKSLASTSWKNSFAVTATFTQNITFYQNLCTAAGALSVASPFHTLSLAYLLDGYSKQIQRTQEVTMWRSMLAAFGNRRNPECLETTHFTLNCRNSKDGYGDKVVVVFQFGYCQIKFRSGRELKICSCVSFWLDLIEFNSAAGFWCSCWQVSRKLSQ